MRSDALEARLIVRGRTIVLATIVGLAIGAALYLSVRGLMATRAINVRVTRIEHPTRAQFERAVRQAVKACLADARCRRDLAPLRDASRPSTRGQTQTRRAVRPATHTGAGSSPSHSRLVGQRLGHSQPSPKKTAPSVPVSPPPSTTTPVAPVSKPTVSVTTPVPVHVCLGRLLAVNC